MRRVIGVLMLCFCFTFAISAQDNGGDRLIGTYMLLGNKGKVSIEKRGNKYFGTVVWTQTQGLLDVHNPDESERKKTVVGKEVLKNFTYSKNDVWENGTIYDPRKGKTYSCKITRMENGNLKVRPFIGFSLLGKTLEWKRLK